MEIKKAAIMPHGIETLLAFSTKPELIGHDNPESSQIYIPGIYVPGHPELQEPFSVPILGDNESTSLSIDWPVKAGVYYKKIAITAMLPAEDFIRGEPLDEDSATIYDSIYFEERNEDLNDAIDEYTGEWGGFLYAAATLLDPVQKVCDTTAEFIIFENSEEFEMTHSLLKSGNVSAAEIVSVTRIHALLNKRDAQHTSLASKHMQLLP